MRFRSSTELNAPETRTAYFSRPVWTTPDGVTAFCSCKLEMISSRLTPSPAS